MKKVSLKEVAASLNVSQTLVSFVINGKAKEKGISKATAERVIAKVKEMNYHPNNFARILRTGKSNTIGILVADISNAFYARIGRNIENIVSKKGYNVIFCSSDEDPDKEKNMLRMMMERGIDGIILSPTRKYSPEIEKEIKELNIPIVLIDRHYPQTDLNYVSIDNYKISKQVTQYLIDKGHKNIGFFSLKPAKTSTMIDRINGYKDCLKENGIDFNKNFHVEFSLKNIDKNINRSIKQLVESQNITALISSNNKITIPAIETMQKENIRIPDDISLISYDYLDVFRILSPPVSSVQLFAEEIGDKSAAMLLKKIDNPENKIKNVVLEAKFHERQSVKDLTK